MAGDFRPYDPFAPHLIHRRRLPHWDQPGAVIFVTFRLGDSLPRDAIERLAELRRHNPNCSNVAQEWVDAGLDAGAGSCILAAPGNATIVGNSLRAFDGSRYDLGRFVVMPNHVHVLVAPRPPFTLERVLHGWKSFSAHQLQRASEQRGVIWQSESYDHIVRSESELRMFDRYIAENPARAKLRADAFLLGHGSAHWLPEEA